MNDISKFQEGTVVYHKATGSKCVVIKVNEDNKTIKVRTDKDLERDYYPQELKTAQEVEAENRALYESMPKKDWGI